MRFQTKIEAIEYYLPKNTLSNENLIEEMNLQWSSEEIYRKTGISSRHIADAFETSTDLGIKAAQQLLSAGICRADDVDFLLFCTQSPDYFLPASACLIHHQLKLRADCGAVDFNQGCSGFIYGLAIAKGLIESGMARKVLLLAAETYSKYINSQDRSTRTIFGDGAAAVLLVASSSSGLGSVVVGTDGVGAENLIVPAGGARNPIRNEQLIEQADENGNIRSKANLYMNGPEIFNFTLRVVPKVVQDILDRENKTIDQIDYFIFHQANKFILDHLRKKLKIAEEKFWIDLSECGNTVSASIPIAIKMALDAGKIKAGDQVMLVGFGVGYSWGACLIEI
ncbi:3-oxoacyl-ACP synthase III family protein [Sporomusa acidovorans]|uniref:3-oxoacyl-[acyl-carrier-protein] synthase 3 n=1 Tax=Sporomusa acidovorans (strain ATCC 49682 / DSM 3132 / Mol) TaxID=1123286 RepID=A0ABZ3J6Q7_SPOA4|nr:ketoacyl-ACP synthase III [Sporomusa acidovorans]OZC19423.1 3-oxoacyl-[acyl-carrier-protein] synthase 3 [Sporomusa acidovorans DSM 3132]SDD76881.1 3-oxoacyl-[acyl-carrier-protein] synthase-3 [Sporomusa acidovorans]